MARERKLTKVNRVNEFFIFENPGDKMAGVITDIRQIPTEFGEADVADIKLENGETRSIIISAGMPDLSQYISCYVEIIYTGEQRNPRTRRRFKGFEVFVDEDDLARVRSQVPF